MISPGFTFTTIGRKLNISNVEPTTNRLLILGTAVDGPLNRPMRVEDPAQIEQIFGPVVYSKGYLDPNDSTESGKDTGATLPLAAATAIAAGCADIYLCRISGTYASETSAFNGRMDIRAQNPGRIYNSVIISRVLSGGGLTMYVEQPAVKGGNFNVQFTSGQTIGDVIQTLNNHPRNTTFKIIRDTFSTYLASACTTLPTAASWASAQLTGGTNGTDAPGEDYATSLNGLASALIDSNVGTFDKLLGERFQFDIAVIDGLYVDDQVTDDSGTKTSKSILGDFAYWIDKMSLNARPCFGVMGVRPPGTQTDAATINWIQNNLQATAAGAWDANLRWNKAGYFLYTGITRSDPVQGTMDLGGRMAVVASDGVFAHPDIGNYIDTAHVAYAAFLTRIPPERAPIFMELPGLVAPATIIPGKFATQLVYGVGANLSQGIRGKGAYVVLVRNPQNYNGPMVIYDDCTIADRGDYFRSYQLMHLANSIHRDLQSTLWGFLGQPSSPAVIGAMETAVETVLLGYSRSGALKGGKGVGFSYKVSAEGTAGELGVVTVYLTIDPATAIKQIHLQVAVRR